MSRPTEKRSSTWRCGNLIVDFRKKAGTHIPIHINGKEVERVASFKFLGVHISEDLSWTLNTSSLVKKAHQHLFFLRRLKKAHLSPQILENFYRSFYALNKCLLYPFILWLTFHH